MAYLRAPLLVSVLSLALLAALCPTSSHAALLDRQGGDSSLPPPVSTGPRRSLVDPKSILVNDPNVVFCSTLPDPLPQPSANILVNADFSNGTAEWFGFGFSDLNVVPLSSTLRYVVNHNRQYDYSGPAQALPRLEAGSYKLSVWLRLSSGIKQFVIAYLKKPNGSFICTGAAILKNHCWTKLIGGFSLTEPLEGAELAIYGATIDTQIWMASPSLSVLDDNVRLASQNLSIKKHRMSPVSISVSSASTGAPLRAQVQVDQTESYFPFGGGLTAAITKDANYQQWFKDRFNWAVYVNEAKWYYTEGAQGQMNYGDADLMTKWCKDNNISVRGHNVFWEQKGLVQDWIKNLDDGSLREAMESRLDSVVSRYAGQFEHWDVDNEMLHWDYFRSRLGGNIQPWMYKATRSRDANVKLFANDYNTVETCDGVSHPEYYLSYIWSLMFRGADLGGIGVESHFGDMPQGVRVKDSLDMLAIAGLPIWITELDFDVADPNLQADYFEMFMREAFSHHGVQGIVLWSTAYPSCDKWTPIDASMCQPCGKCLADFNFKDRPIGERYLALRREWSTHLTSTTSVAGSLGFNAFHGSYTATVTYQGESKVITFDVPVGSETVQLAVNF